MNAETWEENIESFIKEINPDIRINHNYIYGYTDARLMASLAYGNLSVLAMEYFIVVFAGDQLLLLDLNMGGSLTGEYAVIPYSDIQSFKVRKGILQYIITIELVGEPTRLKFKCNRKMLNAQMMGMGWQKENLDFMASQGWDGLA